MKKNNLEINNPVYISEWNDEKNGSLKPNMIAIGSKRKVWWKCKEGHEWEAAPLVRKNGFGCPYCSGRKPIPGENDFGTLYPQLASEWNDEKNGELTPQMLRPGSGKKAWWKCKEGHEWFATVTGRVHGHNCPICSGNIIIAGKTDLATVNPQLALEWNYEKNGRLKPQMITNRSNKRVWWKCKEGHEWQGIVYIRDSGSNCPYCSGKKVIEGKTDLATINPQLASEWDNEKNGKLTPQMVKYNSPKEIWWRCKRNHSWKAMIWSRNIKKQGCPYCAGQRVIIGENDLATLNPKLALEWDYERNGDLTPQMIKIGSGQKVWWKCSDGHHWQATPKTRQQNGCPYCAGIRAIPGENDFLSLNTDLAKEWDYEKNVDLKPQDYKQNSHKKVWWKCEKGHSWNTTIQSRQREGCPYCSGKRIIIGETDLATVNPKLASEWNYEKNRELTPQEVKSGSNKKVWWKCEKGHEWCTSVLLRTRGRGCPYCAGKKAIIGVNDLGTTNPELISEWNYEKNGEITPQTVKSGSSKKVWWKCKNGHEWQSPIANRVIQKQGCPYCSRRKVMAGETDLATETPELLEEWCFEKNNRISPQNVFSGSKNKVWWKCKNGHIWRASILQRKKGNGCPICYKISR